MACHVFPPIGRRHFDEEDLIFRTKELNEFLDGAAKHMNLIEITL